MSASASLRATHSSSSSISVLITFPFPSGNKTTPLTGFLFVLVKRKQKAVGQSQQKGWSFTRDTHRALTGEYVWWKSSKNPKSYENSFSVLKYTDIKRCTVKSWPCSQKLAIQVSYSRSAQGKGSASNHEAPPPAPRSPAEDRSHFKKWRARDVIVIIIIPNSRFSLLAAPKKNNI